MNTLSSLGTFFTSCTRRAWQRHCEIMQMTYELDATSDQALAEMGVARGDVADVARGRFARA